MKCFLYIMLSLHCIIFAAHAADPGDPVLINPRIWNFGNTAQVDVWNTTDADIDCSGTISLYARSGRNQTEFYWETLYRGFSRTNTYRLRDFNDQVVSVFHTIRCRER